MSVGKPRAARRSPAWRIVAAVATALSGILELLSSVTYNLPWRERLLDIVESTRAQEVAHIAGVAGALALFALSWGVARGRRRAGVAAVAVLLVLVAVNLAEGDASAIRGHAVTALHVLLALVVLAAALGLRALLWPTPAQDGHDRDEHERAARIVAAHGGDSLAPFVLRADKAFFFAEGG